MDKFLLVDDILRKNPKLRIFSYGILFLSLIIYWSSIGRPPFFLLTVAQTLAWFTNFAKHFLQDEYIKRYMDESNMLPKDPSNFKWSHLVGLMSYVSKSKHERSIINVLGLWVNNLKYPNIAKRYLPVDESMTTINPILKKTVSLIIPTFSGFMLFGMITKLRVYEMENLAEMKKKGDAMYEKKIIRCQEQIEKNLNQANSYSHNYMVIEQLLKEKGITNITFVPSSKTNKNSIISDQSIFSSFSFETSIININENLEIKELFIELNFYKAQYLNTIDYLKKLVLKQVSLKKIVDSDVKLVNINIIEKFFAPNHKTLYELPGLGLDPENLIQKAKKDSKIKDLMEEAFLPKQTCYPLDLQKIKELFVKIYPFLDPFFEEVRHEFINGNIARIKKQNPGNTNLEESNGLDE
jgi:hypothetical protein